MRGGFPAGMSPVPAPGIDGVVIRTTALRSPLVSARQGRRALSTGWGKTPARRFLLFGAAGGRACGPDWRRRVGA